MALRKLLFKLWHVKILDDCQVAADVMAPAVASNPLNLTVSLSQEGRLLILEADHSQDCDEELGRNNGYSLNAKE